MGVSAPTQVWSGSGKVMGMPALPTGGVGVTTSSSPTPQPVSYSPQAPKYQPPQGGPANTGGQPVWSYAPSGQYQGQMQDYFKQSVGLNDPMAATYMGGMSPAQAWAAKQQFLSQYQQDMPQWMQNTLNQPAPPPGTTVSPWGGDAFSFHVQQDILPNTTGRYGY